MDYNLLSNIKYCSDYVSDVHSILLYSHLAPTFTTIFLAVYLFSNKHNTLTITLLKMTVLFTVWTVLNLTIWLSFNNPTLLMFAWSQIEIVATLLFLYTFIFTFNYLYKKTLPKRVVLVLLIPIIGFIVCAPSFFTTEFDAQECVAIENSLYANAVLMYKLLLSFMTVVIIIIRAFSKEKLRSRSETLIVGTGVLIFLYTFLISSYLSEITDNYLYEMTGVFSIIPFLGCLTYTVTTFNTLNFKIIGAKILVTALFLMTASQIIFFSTPAKFVVDSLTILGVFIVSIILLQNIKKQNEQREQIEKLAQNLEKANTRLQALDKQKSEFVSIASHQLRSPLAAIRGYTSMLLDGTYGTMTSKATGALDRIHESAKLMAFSIEDFLNVSRIESGNMKYELSDFNLKEQAEHVVDDLRPEAVRAGLLLMIKTNITSQGVVHADIGKTQQILHNLINNALKYTQKGTITIVVQEQKKPKQLIVEFIDTGIGMSQVTISELFEKFSRAKNANTVNIKGTGLGLFVAREMARAMGGDITAHSEGEGMGSRFILTLPLVA